MEIERITVDPHVMGGQPVIKGTRITVALILNELGRGASAAEVLEQYPHLALEDVWAAASYASKVVAGEILMAAE